MVFRKTQLRFWGCTSRKCTNLHHARSHVPISASEIGRQRSATNLIVCVAFSRRDPWQLDRTALRTQNSRVGKGSLRVRPINEEVIVYSWHNRLCPICLSCKFSSTSPTNSSITNDAACMCQNVRVNTHMHEINFLTYTALLTFSCLTRAHGALLEMYLSTLGSCMQEAMFQRMERRRP